MCVVVVFFLFHWGVGVCFFHFNTIVDIDPFDRLLEKFEKHHFRGTENYYSNQCNGAFGVENEIRFFTVCQLRWGTPKQTNKQTKSL